MLSYETNAATAYTHGGKNTEPSQIGGSPVGISNNRRHSSGDRTYILSEEETSKLSKEMRDSTDYSAPQKYITQDDTMQEAHRSIAGNKPSHTETVLKNNVDTYKTRIGKTQRHQEDAKQVSTANNNIDPERIFAAYMSYLDMHSNRPVVTDTTPEFMKQTNKQIKQSDVSSKYGKNNKRAVKGSASNEQRTKRVNRKTVVSKDRTLRGRSQRKARKLIGGVTSKRVRTSIGGVTSKRLRKIGGVTSKKLAKSKSRKKTSANSSEERGAKKRMSFRDIRKKKLQLKKKSQEKRAEQRRQNRQRKRTKQQKMRKQRLERIRKQKERKQKEREDRQRKRTEKQKEVKQKLMRQKRKRLSRKQKSKSKSSNRKERLRQNMNIPTTEALKSYEGVSSDEGSRKFS